MVKHEIFGYETNHCILWNEFMFLSHLTSRGNSWRNVMTHLGIPTKDNIGLWRCQREDTFGSRWNKMWMSTFTLSLHVSRIWWTPDWEKDSCILYKFQRDGGWVSWWTSSHSVRWRRDTMGFWSWWIDSPSMLSSLWWRFLEVKKKLWSCFSEI